MNECLIQNNPNKNNTDTETSSFGKDELFKFDPVKETLKHVHPRSKLKKNLVFILLKFYSCQISLLFIAFILGILVFGLPLLFIYNSLISNKIIPILIICIICFLFSISIIVVHCIDGKKNRAQLISKWERKIILKNLGLSITLMILIISPILGIIFYSKLNHYKEDELIILDYENTSISYELKTDFLFGYILNMIYFEPSSINENNKKNTIKYYSNEKEEEKLYIDVLRDKMLKIYIPLLIISFNKVIKSFLIEVKFTLEQMVFFFGAFLFCLFNIIINNYKYKKLSDMNIDAISGFQIINLGIIYLGYISWIIHNSFKEFHNPKDKNFAIRKYKTMNLVIIFLFDLVSLLGATTFFLSILYFYFSEETFNDLETSYFILRVGFLLIILGNSYYLGHHLLSMIFRPISIQYAPHELKNNCYIKANRKLINALKLRKTAIKLKEVKKIK